jgi:integrase
MHKIRAGKKAPKQPKPNPIAMTAEESQRFLGAASSTAYGFMFELAFFLGARPCEWLGLKWADPDVPLKAISARLGHTSIRTTADIYGVVDDERGRQVSERVGQLFGIGKK